ncbi:MAG: protein-tyrosine kinase [Paracoccaceae bacterium]|jgi:protein-tyrosine kinase
MTDTNRPRRGPSDDENSPSGKNMSDADNASDAADVSSSNPSSSNVSSSVEKAAERLSRAQDANSPQPPPVERTPTDQTSSIERFLNANDGDALGEPSAALNAFEDVLAPIPADGPVSPVIDTPTAFAREPADPVQAATDKPVQQAPPQAGPIHPPEPAAEKPPISEESQNHDRAAHSDLEDVPQTALPGTDDVATVPPKRGLFRSKRNEPKPWHRDQAAEQPADAADLTPAIVGEPEVPTKNRGVLGMIWGMVRFLLIGRKRPNKAKVSVRQTPPRRGPLLASRLASRLIPGLVSRRAPGVTTPRRGVLRRLKPFLVARISKVPGLRRLAHTKAEIERVASETPAGIAEIAAETRRSTAGSHIQRPLDMSRRVGRSVEINIEKIRAAGMVTPFGERTPIAEEFRLIKRPLLLNAFEKGANAIRNGNVIMVTSSRSGEGKTFMAANLAMSIASERDLTVLLIDADVAKPDIPNVLGFEADLGLVDLIADDQIDMSQVIMRTNIENLSVMPAGRPHHLATELLASERMGNLVSELSLRYPERVVIMDSPPALLSSVAGVLALNVGQTLFVVEAERTSQSAVDSAIGLVSACKNINLLLNKGRQLGGGERSGSYESSYY